VSLKPPLGGWGRSSENLKKLLVFQVAFGAFRELFEDLKKTLRLASIINISGVIICP
jgi:hypothetical protein